MVHGKVLRLLYDGLVTYQRSLQGHPIHCAEAMQQCVKEGVCKGVCEGVEEDKTLIQVVTLRESYTFPSNNKRSGNKKGLLT